MAYSREEVAQKLNAESVAGNLIVGERADRVFVGKTSEEGIFSITEEGEAMLAALETKVSVNFIFLLFRSFTSIFNFAISVSILIHSFILCINCSFVSNTVF
jgi:hypothetical protein